MRAAGAAWRHLGVPRQNLTFQASSFHFLVVKYIGSRDSKTHLLRDSLIEGIAEKERQKTFIKIVQYMQLILTTAPYTDGYFEGNFLQLCKP